MAPAWDTGKLFTDLAAQSARLQPLIRKLNVKEWTGAPDTYGPLLATLVEDNQAIPEQAKAVSQHPEKLADSLQLLLRVHTVETNLPVVLAGLRKYGNPALADLIEGVAAEGAPARQTFSQRVVDLTAQREEQFEVADHEAQRCREILSKNPAADRRPVKSK